MEYISPRILIEHGVLKDSHQKSDDRLSELTNFCNAFSDDAVAAQCWGELSLPAIEAFQNDANSVFSFCAQAPGDTAVEQCDSRVIANFVISHKFDLVEAKKICSFFIQPEEIEECYMQIVAVALGQLSDVAKVKDFCISLPAPSRTRCLERIVKVQS